MKNKILIIIMFISIMFNINSILKESKYYFFKKASIDKKLILITDAFKLSHINIYNYVTVYNYLEIYKQYVHKKKYLELYMYYKGVMEYELGFSSSKLLFRYFNDIDFQDKFFQKYYYLGYRNMDLYNEFKDKENLIESIKNFNKYLEFDKNNKDVIKILKRLKKK